MAEIEKRSMPHSDAMSFVQEASEIGMNVARPYKTIIKWLVISFTTLLILCNLVWGALYFYEIKMAYENPSEFEVEQFQDAPDINQEQNVKSKD